MAEVQGAPNLNSGVSCSFDPAPQSQSSPMNVVVEHGSTANGTAQAAVGPQDSVGTGQPGSSANGNTQCESRRISAADIQRVQNLIERCLQLYMPRKEVVQTLQAQAKIEPSFTNLVWQKLEEQNPDFFRAYYTRLKLKDQIVMFNYLLEQQVHMVQKLHMNWLQALPSLMTRPGMPMPPMPLMPGAVPGMLPNGNTPFPQFPLQQNVPPGMPGQMMLSGMPMAAPVLDPNAGGFGHSLGSSQAHSHMGTDMLTSSLNDAALDTGGSELQMLSSGLQEHADDIMVGLGSLSSLQNNGNGDSHGGFGANLGLDINNSDLPNLPKSFSFSDFGGLDLATHISEGNHNELVDLDHSDDDDNALPDFGLSDMANLDFETLGKA